MILEGLWFYLWGLLWAVYFVADGFDLGVGMLLPFVSKNETDKRVLYNAVGPLWDGNEVWLITAGGVTFAAFPKTYAVMFSSLYTALTLLIVVLIVRGASLEYRSKVDRPGLKKLCDGCQFVSSGLIALLIGVAFANIFRGLPIVDGVSQGGFFDQLNPYGICGGVFFICIFLLHGAVLLAAKTSGDLHDRVKKVAGGLWFVVLAVTVVFLAYTYIETKLYANYLARPVLFGIPAAAVAALLGCRFFLAKNACWKSWFASALFIMACTFFCIVGLFPNMLPSSIEPTVNSITYHDAASSQLTLKVMLGVVGVFIPLILCYQTWAWRLFRHKIKTDELIY